jgi:diguanylate cyclase (GGDEF)-like protein
VIRFSLKTKLLAALTAILLASFFVTSLINYQVTRESVREELMNSSLPLTGKNIYSEIHGDMMRPILVASSMASDTFLWDWVKGGEKDVRVIKRYLGELKHKNDFLLSFFVSHVSDTYYYNGGVLKKVAPRDPLDVWYYAFLRTGKEYMLNVDHSEAENGRLSIFVNHRVRDEHGKLLGVTGVGLDMTRAAGLLVKAREQYGRDVYLVDRDGLVQVHPDMVKIKSHSIMKEKGLGAIADKVLKPRAKPESFEFDRNGEHILLSALYIPEFEWYLLVEQNEGEALSAARDNLYRTLLIGFIASLLIIFLCVALVNHYQGRLEDLIKTDPLTGAVNRRGLEEAFGRAVHRNERNGTEYSIVLIDLDGFKDINDRHGHLEGDRLLRKTAEAIRNDVRPMDTVSRWGGDEFMVLLEGDADQAMHAVERFQNTLGTMDTVEPITFSCGLSEYRPGDSLDALFHRADLAMYKAKSEGGYNACRQV